MIFLVVLQKFGVQVRSVATTLMQVNPRRQHDGPVQVAALRICAHFTIFRWVQQYSPDLDKRCRLHLKKTNDSWRVDETYAKVRGKWIYLYRAVDSTGQILDSLLNETRSTRAAKRCFRKILGRPNVTTPRVINVDKNPTYIGAIQKLKQERLLSEQCKRRPSHYMNNLVEQDHRFMKRRIKPGLGFGSYSTACGSPLA